MPFTATVMDVVRYSNVDSAAQRRGMFIQMQPTPNPASMMFLPGKTVMQVGW